MRRVWGGLSRDLIRSHPDDAPWADPCGSTHGPGWVDPLDRPRLDPGPTHVGRLTLGVGLRKFDLPGRTQILGGPTFGSGFGVIPTVTGPLGPLGFKFAQHSSTTRPSVERTAEKAFLLPDRV